MRSDVCFVSCFLFLSLLLTVQCKVSFNPFSKVIESRRGFYQGYPDYSEVPPAPIAFMKKSTTTATNADQVSNLIDRMDVPRRPIPPSHYFYNQHHQPWAPNAILAPVFTPMIPYEVMKQAEQNMLAKRLDAIPFAPYAAYRKSYWY